MSVSVSSQPVVKKKQVRFASMEDDDDNDDQEEDTLFDKRKDVRKGFKSMIKSNVNRTLASTGFDSVKIISIGRGTNDPGVCGRWMITLTLCASFLGLVSKLIHYIYPAIRCAKVELQKNVHPNQKQPIPSDPESPENLKPCYRLVSEEHSDPNVTRCSCISASQIASIYQSTGGFWLAPYHHI